MSHLSRLIIAILAVTLLTGFGPFRDKRTNDEKRQDIQSMREEVLAMLYAEAPEAEAKIANAAGYAVFSNVGFNVLVLSTVRGYGIAHDNSIDEDTYMRVFSAGVGVGYGVKDFRAIFVFETSDALDYFIEEGWQATAQTDAAAVSGEKGDEIGYEIEVAPGVKLYQITETGLALQATIQGTKYLVDEDLN